MLEVLGSNAPRAALTDDGQEVDGLAPQLPRSQMGTLNSCFTLSPRDPHLD